MYAAGVQKIYHREQNNLLFFNILLKVHYIG